MKTVFKKTETSISNTKRKKKMLRKDVDRLLEDVICVDTINAVLLHSVAYAFDYIAADSFESVENVENTDNVSQIKSLTVENERLLNDISNEKRRLPWCKKDCQNRELALQNKIN